VNAYAGPDTAEDSDGYALERRVRLTLKRLRNGAQSISPAKVGEPSAATRRRPPPRSQAVTSEQAARREAPTALVPRIRAYDSGWPTIPRS